MIPLSAIKEVQHCLPSLHSNGVRNSDELLKLSVVQLRQLLQCSTADVIDIRERVASAVCPKPASALDLWRKQHEPDQHFPTPLKTLNQILGGGIPAGIIVEFVGKAGVGKTHFCLSLCAHAWFSRPLDDEIGIIFIETEKKFEVSRLIEVAIPLAPAENTQVAIERYANSIQIKQPQSYGENLPQLPAGQA